MPTYLKAGYEPRNVGKITSRAFFIKRLGCTIHRKWGAVEIGGHSIKTIRWSNGYPATKEDTFKTIDDAKEFMRVSILRRLSNGYDKIPQTIK